MMRGIGRWIAGYVRPPTGVIVALVLAAGLQPATSQASASLVHFEVGAPPIAPVVPVEPLAPPLSEPPTLIHRELADADNPSSDSVGATVSDFRVDESGGMHYTVPLYVPPGSAGFVPQLSLEYSSRGSQGPLGPGWGIGGLSNITLCRKGREFGDGNGPFAGLGFDADDSNQAWCMDGLRLLDAGSIGSCPARASYTGRAYTLELDQSTRICAYRPTGAVAVAYWLIFPKDGTLQRYGFTTDSQLAPNNGVGIALPGQVLNWALDKRVDAAGNSIDFVYTTDTANGEQLISEIRYTGHVSRSDPHTLTPDRATYNHVAFTYDSMPSFASRIDWLAGSKVSQSKRLTTVTVNGTKNNGTTPDTTTVVRTYQLGYTEFSTGSRAAALTSIKECAPNPVGGDVCYPATRFSWGATPTTGFPTVTSNTSYATAMSSLVDSKVGDINGDGRQDLVWVQCMPGGTAFTRFQIMISLSNGTTLAAPVATNLSLRRANDVSCATDLRSLYLGNLWHLYDFTGDGRDDLLMSNGSTWVIIPAKTDASGTTFSSLDTINTGIPSQYGDDGHLIDLDGDALPDLLHVSEGGSGAVRFLRRATSGPAYAFQSTDVGVDIDGPSDPVDLPPDFFYSSASLSASLRRGTTAADINGDGASDMMLRVKYEDVGGGCPTCLTLPLAPASDDAQTPTALNRFYWFVYRNAGIQPNGRLKLTPDAQTATIGQSTATTNGTISNDGDDVWLTDINGDAQADLVYKRIGGNGRYFVYRLNQGKATATAAGDSFGPEQTTQATGLSVDETRSVMILDINGDNRRDLLYAKTSGGLRANLLAASGFGTTDTAIGNTTLDGAYAQAGTRQFFLDIDGDGAPDSATYSSSATRLYITKNVVRNGGSGDLMESATNGLGAVQSVEYVPLSYASVYERAYDASEQQWGRSSPVFDVFASLRVVRRAAQSAPTADSDGAFSFVSYRYAGARMQSGGRGFLGFASVQSEDEQNHLVTTTTYRQDFPFIGRPQHTSVVKVSGVLPDPCATNPNGPTCFPEPPDCGTNPCPRPERSGFSPWLAVEGQLLSDSDNSWASVPALNPAFPLPVQPYLADSIEQKYDLATPGLLSHVLQSTFTSDIWGNVTGSTVISRREQGVSLVTDETQTSSHVYGCTLTPPTVAGCTGGSLNAERQRLGRLSISTVTTSRPAATAVLRRSSFEYDSTTGQLIAEIQGPYTTAEEPSADVRKTLGLRTDTVRDSNGNPTLQVTCSTAHFADRTACINLTDFQQQQWSDDPTKIQRYQRTTYEPKGRFPLRSVVPFYSATGTGNAVEGVAEATGVDVTTSGSAPVVLTSSTTLTMKRNASGDPLTRVDVVGNLTMLEYGLLGRARFQSDLTGTFARTRLAWCTDVVNADIPAGYTRVNCPVGARYRVMADSTGESGAFLGLSIMPTAWSYHDRLGREILKTTRIYQQDTASTSRWSSVATRYDRTGRPLATTVPYFSSDPNGNQTTSRAGTALSGTPALATVTYDAIGRSTAQTHPDSAANTPSSSTALYDALKTDLTNPRNQTTQTQKNARDETRSSTDALGLSVSYGRNAIGNLTAVTRTPTDGDSAGSAISTTMSYDRLGRRTAIADPDKGNWTFRFNALGEPIGHVDAKGQVQTLIRDALGRLILRTENRLSANGGYVSEPSSTWAWDTATRPGDLGAPAGGALRGLVVEESNGIGGYQRTMAYDDLGRAKRSARRLDGTAWIERQTWDSVGRPYQHYDASTDAASTAGTAMEYSSDGYPIRVRETASNQLYQEVMSLTSRAQVRQERYHDAANLTTVRTFEGNSGRLLTINTGNAANGALQRWDFTWDKNGNLSTRWQHSTGYDLREDFTYDALDRISTIELRRNNTLITPTTTHTYDGLGNLMTKTGSAAWHYGGWESGCDRAAGKHAASSLGTTRYCYDANGNQTKATYSGGTTRTISYTGYDLPEAITATGTPSTATVGFKYGPDRSMWKRTDGTTTAPPPGCPTAGDRLFCDGFDGTAPPPGITATYYAGNVEIRQVGNTRTIKRSIGAFLIITSTQTDNNPPTGTTYNYLLRDGLGSIDVITDQTGSVQQRVAFDAWGQRRTIVGTGNLWEPMSSALAASFDTTRTRQGYTGHEQLDAVGLIHMKGRLYDPQLHRFIQADPFSESHVTQGLNRYSYVLNNPLSATDPSGYLSVRQWVGLIIVVIASIISQQYWAIGNYLASFAVAVAGGFASAYIATGSLRAGLWGAVSAGVAWGLGAAYSYAGWTGTAATSGQVAARVATRGIAGGVLSDLQGGNFGHGFASAGVSEALNPAVDVIDDVGGRVVARAVVNGTVSKISGDTFANGAISGAFQQAFGEVVRSSQSKGVQGARIGGGEGKNGPAANFIDKSYSSADEALAAAKSLIDGYPNSGTWEYGGVVLRIGDRFYITDPVTIESNDKFSFSGIKGAPDGARIHAVYHNHPDAGPAPSWFSADDIDTARRLGVSSYIFTPKGTFMYFAHNYGDFSAWTQTRSLRAGRETFKNVHPGIEQ